MKPFVLSHEHGISVLGAPIGHNSFCIDFAIDKLAAFRMDAERITEHLAENKQILFLVLRFCLSHSLDHLARVIPPLYMVEAAHRFDDEIRHLIISTLRTLSTLFGDQKENEIIFLTDWDDDVTTKILQLPCSMGGLGFTSLFRTHSTTYVAGFHEALSVLEFWYPAAHQFLLTARNDPVSYTHHLLSDGMIAVTDLYSSLDKPVPDLCSFKLQEKFTNAHHLLLSKKLTDHLSSIYNDKMLPERSEASRNKAILLHRQFLSQSLPPALAWLTSIPTVRIFTMTNKQFLISCIRILGLNFVPVSLRDKYCFCCSDTKPDRITPRIIVSRARITPLHVAVCRITGDVIRRHNGVQALFIELCQLAGFSTTCTNLPSLPSDKRGDFTVTNPKDSDFTPLICDVGVTCPIQQKQVSSRDMAPLAAANIYHAAKIKKYLSEYAQFYPDHKFIPLIFESFGSATPLTIALLDSIAKKLPPASTLFGSSWATSSGTAYVAQRFSLQVARGTSNAIISTTRRNMKESFLSINTTICD